MIHVGGGGRAPHPAATGSQPLETKMARKKIEPTPVVVAPPRRVLSTARQELARRFAYHPPSTARAEEQHATARAKVGNLAEHFRKTLPSGREQALAITKLEEALFWANAAIARHQED